MTEHHDGYSLPPLAEALLETLLDNSPQSFAKLAEVVGKNKTHIWGSYKENKENMESLTLTLLNQLAANELIVSEGDQWRKLAIKPGELLTIKPQGASQGMTVRVWGETYRNKMNKQSQDRLDLRQVMHRIAEHGFDHLDGKEEIKNEVLQWVSDVFHIDGLVKQEAPTLAWATGIRRHLHGEDQPAAVETPIVRRHNYPEIRKAPIQKKDQIKWADKPRAEKRIVELWEEGFQDREIAKQLMLEDTDLTAQDKDGLTGDRGKKIINTWRSNHRDLLTNVALHESNKEGRKKTKKQ